MQRAVKIKRAVKKRVGVLIKVIVIFFKNKQLDNVYKNANIG